MRCLMPTLAESTVPKTYNIRPVDGAQCMLLIDGVSDSTDLGYPIGEEFTFVVGESDSDLGDAIDNEVFKLKAGQTSNKISYTKDNSDPIEIQVTLNSFQNRPPIGNLTDDEKLEIAKHHKTRGVVLFKQELFNFAFRRFSKALKFLILLLPHKEASSRFIKETNELRVHCYSNMALCQMKFNSYDHVKQNCDKALAIDPRHVKSWYRKAEACYRQGYWSDCEKAVRQGLKIEPHNKSLLLLLEQALNAVSKK